WFPLIGTQCKRAAGAQELWLSFAANDPEGQAPSARWLSKTDNENYSDISLSSSPVLAAENLQERLWQSCAGAVLTSATLSALGQFDMLKMRAGLPEHTNYLSIASPFDYASSASLVVPRMNCEPSNGERHTELIVKAIPKLIDKNGAALMLFSSRRQMQDVLQRLPNEWYELILCQDDYQKSQLLKYHRQRIDKGEGSIIFGLSSFAEGVDLPGKYCTHVLIAKIPFAVPNDPIELTLSEWIEQKGMNPFMTLAVPDAAFKLVQASGRLLRNEKDTGKITLFDERIVSKRYGKAILDSMPPYKREIFLQEID
ncbi:MAG: ATP-dependent DNA helicase DinG, partial [Gammaproteobacteria bacterium]|nr:ATP-dependent DNA helicase DinG [Gammaproteobacteria bacterium]